METQASSFEHPSVPPQVVLTQIAFGAMMTQTLGVAAKLGICESGLIFISFTIRGVKYRIITARKASKRMHKIYAEND